MSMTQIEPPFVCPICRKRLGLCECAERVLKSGELDLNCPVCGKSDAECNCFEKSPNTFCNTCHKHVSKCECHGKGVISFDLEYDDHKTTILIDPKIKHFAYQHLPGEMQMVSRPFYELAASLCNMLDRGPEFDMMIRKLLEAKDCAIRAQKFPGE